MLIELFDVAKKKMLSLFLQSESFRQLHFFFSQNSNHKRFEIPFTVRMSFFWISMWFGYYFKSDIPKFIYSDCNGHDIAGSNLILNTFQYYISNINISTNQSMVYHHWQTKTTANKHFQAQCGFKCGCENFERSGTIEFTN